MWNIFIILECLLGVMMMGLLFLLFVMVLSRGVLVCFWIWFGVFIVLFSIFWRIISLVGKVSLRRDRRV